LIAPEILVAKQFLDLKIKILKSSAFFHQQQKLVCMFILHQRFTSALREEVFQSDFLSKCHSE